MDCIEEALYTCKTKVR